jgi:hypothetical protein
VSGSLPNQLRVLEQVLAAANAAIVPHLHTGLDAERIVELLRDLGLTPSREVVEWFSWHNGAGVRGMKSSLIELVPGGEFYDLEFLCARCQEERQIDEELVAAGAPWKIGERWSADWFPLLRLFGKGYVAVDLVGGSISPVHVAWHDDDIERRQSAAWPSIEAFVVDMIERFRAGAYWIDHDGFVSGNSIDRPNQ